MKKEHALRVIAIVALLASITALIVAFRPQAQGAKVDGVAVQVDQLAKDVAVIKQPVGPVGPVKPVGWTVCLYPGTASEAAQGNEARIGKEFEVLKQSALLYDAAKTGDPTIEQLAVNLDKAKQDLSDHLKLAKGHILELPNYDVAANVVEQNPNAFWCKGIIKPVEPVKPKQPGGCKACLERNLKEEFAGISELSFVQAYEQPDLDAITIGGCDQISNVYDVVEKGL